MNKITGRKDITIKYSSFYRRYFIWTDLTKEELQEIEGVKSVHKGSEYAEVEINPRYNEEIVLKNIRRLVCGKQKGVFGWIMEGLGYDR